ncbi:MAG TPA: 16S rRNA (cytosine(967)-C(5))-methyltransferase RsmB [Rhodanobacteraceae bacterium]|nr:16S rRNA (cytosine(967)-C(5))-methyltransferase RsmB [Rhodanobacteraceae bacterium]
MNPGAALRAEAAKALARVVFDGVSLRAALAASTPRFADPRDRALFSASLFTTTRWWLRLDAALAMLLEKPLPPKARDVRALLVLGLAQIAELDMPDYAVVASCVDAARALGQPSYAGLVNALLRRFGRERAELEAKLDRDAATRTAHPPWLIDALRRDWPDDLGAILDANNCEAPLTLRVNRRRGDRASMLQRLADADIAAKPHDDLADAIVLDESADVTRLPGYAEGLFSVQDGAAQRVADVLDLRDGLCVLDACAAPGGKAAHVLERADVDLVALDRDAARLPRIAENLARLGLRADIREGDAAAPKPWWDGRPFDRILLDAPCSATGIVRRQPDVKLHRRAADIAPLAATQKRLLEALWPLLAPGGRLVYATCSVLRAENEAVLAAFRADQADAQRIEVPVALGRAAGDGRQNLPGTGGMDGFYYAIVEKAR